MRRRFVFRLLLSLSGLMLVAGAASAQAMSPAEQKVWSGEQRYWDLRTAGKTEEYMTLWHEEFTGWPRTSAQPSVKADVRSEVSNILKNTRPGSYVARLQPLSVRIHGDFAFVFYRVQAARVDAAGNRVETRIRIHHTWWHTPSGWKIIAGMSANDQNYDATPKKAP